MPKLNAVTKDSPADHNWHNDTLMPAVNELYDITYFHKFIGNLPSAVGYASAITLNAPTEFEGKFEVLSIWFANANMVWQQIVPSVEVNNSRTKITLYLKNDQGAFVNLPYRLVIAKI